MPSFRKTVSLVLFINLLLLPIFNVEAKSISPRFESDKTPEVERKPIPISESEELLPQYEEAPQSASAQGDFTTQATLVGPNLVPNPELETVSVGGLPASWKKGGYGTNTRTFTYPVPGVTGQAVSLVVSNYQSGDAKWYFDYVAIEGGSTYRFSNQYKSSTSSIVTVQYKLANGSFAYKDILTLDPQSNFTPISQDFVAPADAVSLTVFHLLKGNGTLTTDNYSLTKLDTTTSGFVPNPGFEEGATSPTGWIPGRWGSNTAVFTYPVTGSGGGKAAKVTLSNRVSGDAKWSFAPITLPPGSYTYRDEYQASVPTYVTVEFTHTNGTKTYQDLAQVPATVGWGVVEKEFVVTSSVSKVTVFHLINQDGTLTLDNVNIQGTLASGGGIFTTGAVTIRLDDNWLSQYKNAFPLFDQAGFDVTLYVTTKQIADTGFPGYMSKAQIEEVYRAGHEIGAHTRTHRDLVTLSTVEKVAEIQGSRDDLLSWGVGPILSFAYPFGSYDAESLQIVKEAGFESAASSNGGLATPDSDPYQLERYGIENTTTFSMIKGWIDKAKLEKNWLILTIHEVEPTCTQRYCMTTALLSQVIDYLGGVGLPVMTVSEAIESLE
jgi:peptidoglycan/xylan/chitin deacetylase (PgdA/CDA1 family)